MSDDLRLNVSRLFENGTRAAPLSTAPMNAPENETAVVAWVFSIFTRTALPEMVGRTIMRMVLPVRSGAKFAPVNAGPIRCPMEMVQAENQFPRPWPWSSSSCARTATAKQRTAAAERRRRLAKKERMGFPLI